MVTMSENVMEMLETKSDTQSIDSSNSKMNKIFQNDDIQKAIDQVNRIKAIIGFDSAIKFPLLYPCAFIDNSIRFN